MKVLVLALVTLFAVDGAASTKKVGKLELSWSMKVVGRELRIDYSVRNSTAKRVVIVDQLFRGTQLDPDAIIVMNAKGLAKTVAFVRAFVHPGKEALDMPEPDGRILEPGATLKGSAVTAWPLRSWHNFDNKPAALKPKIARAVLEIGYMEEPFTMDGNTPDGTQKLLRSNIRTLPHR